MMTRLYISDLGDLMNKIGFISQARGNLILCECLTEGSQNKYLKMNLIININ